MNSDNRRRSILIVDDTPGNLQALSEILRQRGYRPRPVLSGKLAIQAATNDPPDLVLLDISMRDMDGYEVCRKFKACGDLKEIPVIFISALDDSIDKVRAFQSGGVDYITKPFRAEEVSARVETHLKLRDLQLKLKEHNRQLEQSNAELHKLQALRDNLTHMIIHDLKGPLTGMTSCLELLHDETMVVTESRREIVATAEQCGAAMLGMIDDMLAVSRLESGQMPLVLQPNNLQDLVRQSISSLGATLHGRTLEQDFPSQDVVVPCDADLIRRVLVNLLSNADRYSSDHAPIRIQVHEAADCVRVAIRDQGEGISPQFRATIFDKFCQLDVGGKRRPHSSGLGLTFCREAIIAHGGTIGVNSEVGGGSEFWFELPRLTDD